MNTKYAILYSLLWSFASLAGACADEGYEVCYTGKAVLGESNSTTFAPVEGEPVTDGRIEIFSSVDGHVFTMQVLDKNGAYGINSEWEAVCTPELDGACEPAGDCPEPDEMKIRFVIGNTEIPYDPDIHGGEDHGPDPATADVVLNAVFNADLLD